MTLDTGSYRQTTRAPGARRATQAALLAAALLGAAACGGGEPAKAAAAPAEAQPAVLGAQDVAVAERADVTSGIVLTGSLQPSAIVQVRAQVSGTVGGVRVDRGTPVRRGQVMAVIQAAGVQGQAAGARAAVAAAQANVALARQQLEAARTLNEAGAMSTIERRSAEAGFEAAQAQLAAARAQAAGAGEAAARATITAPISGVVSERAVEGGEAVNGGDALFTVVNSSTLELDGQIQVEEAARVRVGQPVEFALEALPGRTLRGTVARVDPTANAQTRRVGVFVQLPNPGGTIVGGQFATGRIVGEQIPGAVVVPTAAVRGSNDSTFVLLIQGSRIARRPVRVGTRDEARGIVAIASGLSAGDRVVAAPGADLAEGARVTVAADQPASRSAAQPDSAAEPAAATPNGGER